MECLSASSLHNLNFDLNDLTTLHWIFISYIFYYFVGYFTEPDKYIVIVTNLENSKVKIDRSSPMNYTKACDHYKKLITQYDTQVCNTFKGKYTIEIVKYDVYKSCIIN